MSVDFPGYFRNQLNKSSLLKRLMDKMDPRCMLSNAYLF